MSKLILENLFLKAGERILMENCNFVFDSNVFYVIFGKSGSGKTTLLKSIANLYPFKGNIKLNNEDISSINPFKYRKKVLYMQQEPILFPGTVRENIEYPFKLKLNKDEFFDENKLKLLLQFTDLSSDILDKNAEKLSGGEKQRVCLVRSLMLNPEFLLLDEPTSALDLGTESEIIKILKNIETSVIVVSHSKTLLDEADKAVLLSDKKLNETNQLSKEEIIKAMGYE
jgi:ABC-type iron transport system FetAB ATPase subunit